MLDRRWSSRPMVVWDSVRLWNVLFIMVVLLGLSLVLIPILDLVLRDPSLRLPALVLGLGIMAGAIVVLTLPGFPSHYLEVPERAGDHSGPARALLRAGEGSEDGMVTSLRELRATLTSRVCRRRRLTEDEWGEVLRSPQHLHELLTDEALERLLLLDLRSLAHVMAEDGRFLESFEEMLKRVEAWK
jgi:hypothetical protein